MNDGTNVSRFILSNEKHKYFYYINVYNSVLIR